MSFFDPKMQLLPNANSYYITVDDNHFQLRFAPEKRSWFGRLIHWLFPGNESVAKISQCFKEQIDNFVKNKLTNEASFQEYRNLVENIDKINEEIIRKHNSSWFNRIFSPVNEIDKEPLIKLLDKAQKTALENVAVLKALNKRFNEEPMKFTDVYVDTTYPESVDNGFALAQTRDLISRIATRNIEVTMFKSKLFVGYHKLEKVDLLDPNTPLTYIYESVQYDEFIARMPPSVKEDIENDKNRYERGLLNAWKKRFKLGCESLRQADSTFKSCYKPEDFEKFICRIPLCASTRVLAAKKEYDQLLLEKQNATVS